MSSTITPLFVIVHYYQYFSYYERKINNRYDFFLEHSLICVLLHGMRCCIQTSLLNSSNANFVWILTLRHNVSCPFYDTVKTPAEFVLHDFFRGGGVVITLHFIISKLLICGNIYSRNQCKTQNPKASAIFPNPRLFCLSISECFPLRERKKDRVQRNRGSRALWTSKGKQDFPQPHPEQTPIHSPLQTSCHH